MLLLFEGEGVIQELKRVVGHITRVSVGETNPEDTAHGTVRKDFGHDVIKNGAHVSDYISSAERKLRIVQIEKDDIGRIVKKYYD